MVTFRVHFFPYPCYSTGFNGVLSSQHVQQVGQAQNVDKNVLSLTSPNTLSMHPYQFSTLLSLLALISSTALLSRRFIPSQSHLDPIAGFKMVRTDDLPSLDTITSAMLRLDEQIIAAFIKRSSFHRNTNTYNNTFGNFRDAKGNKLSYLEYRISKVESFSRKANTPQKYGDAPSLSGNHSKKSLQSINAND